MQRIDDFTITRSAGAGFALSALNPKSVLLVVAAAAEIAERGLSAGEQAIVLLAFVLVASVGVLMPLVAAVALGDRSREPLDRLRTWLTYHSAAIMAALLVVIGAKLIGDAVSGFSS
jgi:threonine/homoserine/homoserine lactone efflux protein